MVKKNLIQPDSPVFWPQHNQAWERSSISQKEYCLQHGLRLSAFGYWRRKLTRSGQSKAQVAEFVKISTATAKAPRVSGLDLVIGDEVVIRIENNVDPELLIKVIQAVRRVV